MASKLTKPTRFCGTCQHYCWTVGPQRKTTCNNLGSIETTPSCTDYSINPFVLQDFERVLKPLADTLRVMPVTTLSMFFEIIAQEKSLRRRGFYFMEKVAVKYWGTAGEKYLSNYVMAHVYSANDEGVFVVAKSGIRMFVFKESVIKLEPFLKFRKHLKDTGKILDPTISLRTASVKQKLAVTETLDDIIARGMVSESDLDLDLKRKLNPKRINNAIERGDSPTEISMSTKKKSDVDIFKIKTKAEVERDKKKNNKSMSIELSTETKGKNKKKPEVEDIKKQKQRKLLKKVKAITGRKKR